MPLGGSARPTGYPSERLPELRPKSAVLLCPVAVAQVVELTAEETESLTGGYGKAISHVIIGLKTAKGVKQLKLDPSIYDALLKEKVRRLGRPSHGSTAPDSQGTNLPGFNCVLLALRSSCSPKW